MPTEDVTRDALTAFADAIDTRDWDRLARGLGPDFTAYYVHTGDRFDRAAFVALNRDYPVVVRFEVDDLVVAGGRAALRARVSDVASDATWFVASFATADAEGLITDLGEVWADRVDPAESITSQVTRSEAAHEPRAR